MSSKKYDFFKDLKKGKYDWKVQARVMNLWRGYSTKGEPFKAFNLLLLDSKRGRIHAFVPGAYAEKIENKIEVGNIYLFANFTVKDYKPEDKFRCIKKSIQIPFGEDTDISSLNEEDVFIENGWFDFYDLADLKPLASQNTYLTDVIGVMEDYDPIGKLKNRHGIVQSQMKFNITDGRTSVRVTFWDDFAEEFAAYINKIREHPLILILCAVRVILWDNQVILTNVGATTYYVNSNHHSASQLRKRCSNPSFSTQNLSTQKNRASYLLKVKDILNLGPNHIETHVICQVKILMAQQIRTWCYPLCTSCYQKVEIIDNVHSCGTCNRVVPYPDMKFEVYTMASDDTAPIQILLEDREVRTLIGKTVFELLNEGHTIKKWPNILQTIQNKECTIMVAICKENIEKKQEYYVATDIVEGYDIQSYMDTEPQQSHPHPVSENEPQASGSSINLSTFSNFN